MKKNPVVMDIANVSKGMDITTVYVTAQNKQEAGMVLGSFSKMPEIATVASAYFEHASSGVVSARICFEGTDDEIVVEDIEGRDKFYVIAF